jgi:hypothetical protein
VGDLVSDKSARAFHEAYRKLDAEGKRNVIRALSTWLADEMQLLPDDKDRPWGEIPEAHRVALAHIFPNGSAPTALPTEEHAETLARFFHETYEHLAPRFSYKTREASAKPWKDVPENNRKLMVAVCQRVLFASAVTAIVEPAPDAREVATRERMWQHKTGALLTLIEEWGDTDMFKRACAMMNVNWYTKGDDSEHGWATQALDAFRVVVKAAKVADIFSEPNEP